MMIDWSTYKSVVAGINSTEMELIVHHMVRNYLYDQATQIEIKELQNLQILVPTTEESKQIVKPFSFMDNDRSQES